MEEQIASTIRQELGLADFQGDHLFEGTIDPDELASAIANRLRQWRISTNPADWRRSEIVELKRARYGTD